MVLFKRCCAFSEALRAAPEWFQRAPEEAKAKLFPTLKALALDALGSPVIDVGVVDALRTIAKLMEWKGNTAQGGMFVKIQRFALDGRGKVQLGPVQDVVVQKATLVAVEILLKHAQKNLFDPNLCVTSFFELLPRWGDDENVARLVLQFCREYAALLHAKTSLFSKYRADILRGWQSRDKLEQDMCEIVAIWSRERVAAPSQLFLETLAEDLVDGKGKLAASVMRNAPTSDTFLQVVREAFRVERERAVEKLPTSVLDEILNCFRKYDSELGEKFWIVFDNKMLLDVNNKPLDLGSETLMEMIIAVSSTSSVTGACICWLLGEYGSKRDWSSAFESLEAHLVLPRLTAYERNATIGALLKFATRGENAFVYEKRMRKTLLRLPVPNVDCDRALAILDAPYGVSKMIG